MHRYLIAEPGLLDINLCDFCALPDQPALLGGPLGETHAEAKDEITFGDQLVRGPRGKAAADAKRPLIARKQAVPANRRREQRSDIVSQGYQRPLGVRQDGTPTRENKWPLCMHDCSRKPAYIFGIGL